MAKQQDETIIPLFKTRGLSNVRQCIYWTWATLKKTRWESEKILTQTGRQTPAEMIAAREIFYMGTCAPQTMACLEALKTNGFSPTMVVDLLKVSGRQFPHFALEIPLGKKVYHINFLTHHTILGNGPYVHSTLPKAESVHQFRIPGNEFGMHKRLTDIRPEIWAELAKSDYYLEQHAAKFARDVSMENFRRFQRTIRSKKGKRIVRKKSPSPKQLRLF